MGRIDNIGDELLEFAARCDRLSQEAEEFAGGCRLLAGEVEEIGGNGAEELLEQIGLAVTSLRTVADAQRFAGTAALSYTRDISGAKGAPGNAVRIQSPAHNSASPSSVASQPVETGSGGGGPSSPDIETSDTREPDEALELDPEALQRSKEELLKRADSYVRLIRELNEAPEELTDNDNIDLAALFPALDDPDQEIRRIPNTVEGRIVLLLECMPLVFRNFAREHPKLAGIGMTAADAGVRAAGNGLVEAIELLWYVLFGERPSDTAKRSATDASAKAQPWLDARAVRKEALRIFPDLKS